VVQTGLETRDDRTDSLARRVKGALLSRLKLQAAAKNPTRTPAAIFNRRDWRGWGGPELEELYATTLGLEV